MTKTQLKKLQTQKNKLKKINKKKINVYKEIESYLFDNTELSDEVFESKTTFRNAINYIFRSLMKNLKVSMYIDSHLNGKIQGLISHEPLEILKFYKKIIVENNIKKFQQYTFFPNRVFNNTVNTIVSKKQYSIKEAKDYIINRSIKNPLELDSLLENKSSSKKEDIEIINLAIKNSLVNLDNNLDITSTGDNASIKPEPIKNTILKNHKVFLQNLDNKIIEELQLTLFDIGILKKSNEFLFIFIDKDNKKRYYKKPFSIEIFINNKTGVLNNDFIEEYSQTFTKYIISDLKIFQQLKYLLRKNYTEFMKSI